MTTGTLNVHVWLAQLILGDAETGYAGFSLPIIQLLDGTQINPAAVEDLGQWQALTNDALSPCAASCPPWLCDACRHACNRDTC